MFDPVSPFEKQFEPFEDGYLYFPNARAGGKFVSRDEYAALMANWTRITGKWGLLKTVAMIVAAIFAWSILDQFISSADWVEDILILAIVALLITFLFWASMAPRRLVIGRPDIVPPRPASQSRLVARSLISWPMIFFGIFFFSVPFLTSLFSSDRSVGTWFWLAGSGAVLACYLWIALQKWRDQGTADRNEKN